MRRRDFVTGALAVPIAAALGARAEPAPSALRVQRLSWAGVKLVCGSSTLFIDASYDPSSASTPAPDVALTSDTKDRNALITHHHGDHFDAAALRGILDNGILVVPESVAPWADTRGLRTQLAKLYEPVMLPRATATFAAISVPAVDGLGHPQVSWVVDAAGKRVFHAGDTAWHGYWWDIARAYGPFDIALLPINGFRQVGGRYTETGVPMSLTPEQAASAAALLKARIAVAIHYGGTSPGYDEEPDAPKRFVAAAAKRGVDARIVAPGAWIEL